MRFKKLLTMTLISSMALSQFAFPKVRDIEIKAREVQELGDSMNQEQTLEVTPAPTPVTTFLATPGPATPGPTQTGPNVTSTPEIPPTPTDYHPRPDVDMTRFYWTNYSYNAAESATLIVEGNFNGVEQIRYHERKLVPNVDYKKELHYIIFTEGFLKTISEGEHQLDVIGYKTSSCDRYKQTITITKYNYKLNDTYKRKYPASETSNFYTTMDCNQSNRTAWFWIKDISKLEKVFVDGVEVERGKDGYITYSKPYYRIIPMNKIGGGILYVSCSALNSSNSKIHYIEAVSNGKSDVLKYAYGRTFQGVDYLFEMNGTKLKDNPISTPKAENDKKPSEYMTGFWVNEKNVYNTAQKGTLFVKGSFEGLNDIYYQGKKLVLNTDYFIGEQVLEFSDDFVERLSDGENELTVFADYSEADQNRSSVVSIRKINVPVKGNREFHCELADTTNILNPLEVCTKDSSYFLLGIEDERLCDAIYIDDNPINYMESSWVYKTYDLKRAILFVQFNNSVFEDLAVGVHTVEFVSDGRSDVAYLVIYDAIHSVEDVLEDGRRDIKYELPAEITPTTSVTPSYPDEEEIDNSYFWMNKNNIFNAAVADDLIVPGRYVGLLRICYNGKVLTKDDFRYGDEFLKFEASFLQSLPSGRNEFTVFADHYYCGGVVSYQIYIDKVDVPMEKAYVSEYPLNEENNFYGTFAIADDYTHEVTYGMKNYKNIDKLIIDHKEVPLRNIANPLIENYRVLSRSSRISPSISASFRLSKEVTYGLSAGIHYVEVVVDGHSEVLYLLRVDGGHFADKLLTTQQKEWNGKVDFQVITCKRANSISQSYTLKQVDTNEAFDLSKVTIKYFYNKKGEIEQEFTCDHAGIQLNQAPYYESFTEHVKGSFGNGYVETSFTDSYELTDNTINIQIRFNQSDWSDYVEFEEGYVEVYYDGKLVFIDK